MTISGADPALAAASCPIFPNFVSHPALATRTLCFPSSLSPPRAPMAKGALSGVSAPILLRAQLTLGMTQTELGALIGASRKTVARWQNHAQTFSPRQIQALASANFLVDRRQAPIVRLEVVGLGRMLRSHPYDDIAGRRDSAMVVRWEGG